MGLFGMLLPAWYQVELTSDIIVLTVVFLFFTSALVGQFIRRVPSGARCVVCGPTGGPRVLQPGFWVITPLSRLIPGPWNSLSCYSTGLWPAPASLLAIDPPRAKVNTCEGITATIDISVNVRVTDWESSDTVLMQLIGDCTDLRERTCALCNMWVSRIVANLPSKQLTYGSLSVIFNAESNLEALDNSLKHGSCPLEVVNVVCDVNGIELSDRFREQRDKAFLEARQRHIVRETINEEAEIEAARRTVQAQAAEFRRTEDHLAAKGTAALELLAAESAAEQRQVTMDMELAHKRRELELSVEFKKADVDVERASNDETIRFEREEIGLFGEPKAAHQKAHRTTMGALSTARLVVAPPDCFGIKGVATYVQG